MLRISTIGLPFERQVDLDVYYKDIVFKSRFRADLIVDQKVLIENKAIKELISRDEAQLMNYLKTTRRRIGLLFNFGAHEFEMIRRIWG